MKGNQKHVRAETGLTVWPTDPRREARHALTTEEAERLNLAGGLIGGKAQPGSLQAS